MAFADSIANNMSVLSGLQNAEVLKSQQNQDLINKAYQPFDKALLAKALSEGGSLGQAQSFTNDNLWAMTPETFQAAMKAQTPVTKQISDAVQLSDMVNGTSEMRKSASAIEHQRLAGAQQNLGTAAHLYGQEQALLQGDKHFRGRLKQDKDTHEASLTAQEAWHKDTHDLGMAHIGLERSRLKYLKDNSPTSGVVAPPGSQTDIPLTGAMDKRLKELGALSIDGTKLTLGEVDPTQKGEALRAYMTREAAKGLPYMQMYNVPEGHRASLGGFPQLVLANDGWHGVSIGPDGKQHASTAPVVPFVQRPKAGTKGSSGGGYTTAPAYDNQE